MAKIVIDDTREIELLDAVKNPDAINFKFGDKFAELTNDLSKTNGSPQLKFSKDSNEYYIREIFEVSGSFYNSGSFVGGTTLDITSRFPFFDKNTKIKALRTDLVFSTTHNVPETGDFSKKVLETSGFVIYIQRRGGTMQMVNSGKTSPNGGTVYYTIE